MSTKAEVVALPDFGPLAPDDRVARLEASSAIIAEIKPTAESVAASLTARYAPVLEREVKTARDLELAGETLREVAGAKKAVEEARKRLKAPALEQGREVDAVFKTVLAPLDAANRALRAKVLAFEAEEAKRRAEQEAELAEQVGSAVSLPKVEAPAGISGQERWVAEVTDKKAFVQACVRGKGAAHLGLIEVNDKDLQALARASKEHLDIPGVTVKKVRGLRVA